MRWDERVARRRAASRRSDSFRLTYPRMTRTKKHEAIRQILVEFISTDATQSTAKYDRLDLNWPWYETPPADLGHVNWALELDFLFRDVRACGINYRQSRHSEELGWDFLREINVVSMQKAKWIFEKMRVLVDRWRAGMHSFIDRCSGGL